MFYRAKTSEFKAGDNLIYNVVFLTHSLRLYNDKALSSEAIRAMRKILYETMHLQREQHKGSKSFEVVLSMLEPELYKGNRPLIHCYIFNVETEEISWPEGVNIWSDRFLGFTGYTVDRFVDIGMRAILFKFVMTTLTIPKKILLQDKCGCIEGIFPLVKYGEWITKRSW